MSEIKSHQDLLAWQKAMDLAVASYSLARSLPAEERFELGRQIRKSASSVAANIAEGYGRCSRRDYYRFLTIANGSLRELETHVALVDRIEMAGKEEVGNVLDLVTETAKLLTCLRRSLGRSS